MLPFEGSERCCRIGLALASLWFFHRQSSTGSDVVTATCATTPLSQNIIKTKTERVGE